MFFSSFVCFSFLLLSKQSSLSLLFLKETGFTGLPKEWEDMLKSAKIPREQVMENPEAVIEVMELLDNLNKGQTKQQGGNMSLADAQKNAGRHNEINPTPQPLPSERPLTLDELVSQEDPTAIFCDMKKIGEGAAGEVFVATTKATGEKVAVKKMALNGESLKLLITEISIMKSSHHENVVDYTASYISEDQLWVVMEFMGGGCLTEVLEQFPGVLMNEGQIALVCAEVFFFFFFFFFFLFPFLFPSPSNLPSPRP